VTATELQPLVEHLGAALGRSVAIDDPHLHLLAYSRHYGDVDHARLESVLTREAPAEAMSYALSFGVGTADGPVKIPANDALGFLARLCVPIRNRGSLLGYIWLIQTDQPLSTAEVEQVERAAEVAGELMRNDRLAQELRLAQEQGLLRDLLGADQAMRRHAATELIELRFVSPPRSVCCLVLRPSGGQGSPSSAIDETLSRARSVWPIRSTLQLGRIDHGALVLVLGQTGGRRENAEVARHITESFRALEAGSWQPRVGIGSWVESLDQAQESYAQALHASRVAEVRGADTTDWAGLGVYRTLTKLSSDELTQEALPPGLSKLLAADGSRDLVMTVEAFLDLAGDVKATSERLILHRTSVYNRLRRVEAAAGIDLGNGLDRLDLHLGLKMARLAGIITEPAVIDR
jgi:DNA-binding PucR family transcriptional regulator